MIPITPITGSYAEALPSGEWAVVQGTNIMTHLGLITGPGEDLLFIRITSGPFKITGQGHNTGIAWEYDGTWHARGATFGVSPLAYTQTGTMVFATRAMGSQGIRFITPSGEIVTGDQTYKHPTLALWEYTDLGNNTLIGQGETGLVVAADGILRQLNTEPARFVRANVREKQVVVSYVNLGGNYAEFLSTTLQALREYPVVSVGNPPNPPNPPYQPEVSMTAPDFSSTFAEEVNKHQDLLGQLKALADSGDANNWPDATQQAHAALRGKLLRFGAYACFQKDPNWGLLEKLNFSNATRADGRKHATDILFYANANIIDCFNDRGPQWGPLDEVRPMSQWIQPIAEEVPPPVPPVDPPSSDLDGRVARLEGLLSQFASLINK